MRDETFIIYKGERYFKDTRIDEDVVEEPAEEVEDVEIVEVEDADTESALENKKIISLLEEVVTLLKDREVNK